MEKQIDIYLIEYKQLAVYCNTPDIEEQEIEILATSYDNARRIFYDNLRDEIEEDGYTVWIMDITIIPAK